MRRQTEYSEAIPNDSGASFRIDPHALPVRYKAEMAGARAAVWADISLSEDRILINRPVAEKVPVAITLPMHVYQGVAVRIEPDSRAGCIRVQLELLHSDPALCVPLTIADHLDDVAADWQIWARRLGLPLLIVEADGRITCPSRKLGRLSVAPVQPRRKRSALNRRRPRFLARRKVGTVTQDRLLPVHEIIARD